MTAPLIRDLNGIAEFRQAEALQRAVWGADDKEDPADLMMVIQHEGGLVAGAFIEDALVGYVFGFPTREITVQHSHRLAVLGSARGLGLGARLKWHQRDWCLARGIAQVRWTFDPLRHANANLNIHHLGAHAAKYFPDFYGALEGINKGAPSDRLLAEWNLEAPAVAARAAGRLPVPAVGTRITIPVDFDQMLVRDPTLATSERLRLRQQFLDRLGEGLVIHDYDAAARAYVLQ